ncbi:MAG: valine--tRNA ligase [Bacillota bacterium]
MAEIPKVYDPSLVENKWYEYWLRQEVFKAKPDASKVPFSIVIPPPNVTGSLHMGHALDNTIQDILIRYKRMRGFETLWLPGTDHAGIATQHVVEESLAEEGKSRYDLGREKFVELVWKWKEKYGNKILLQLQRLGASCDWSRLRFTMDAGCSRAVREVFVRLYEKGLIYRGDYIINWCPECGTALSDIEVEHEEDCGQLWYVRYPLESGNGDIVVATTRPETILGDTAVAVHPDDARYTHLVGSYALLPVLGRRIPIIADDYVDPEFGSGAVKVTPAHDPNDFDIGKRHHLSSITVIGPDGIMTEEAGPYSGLDRFECRRKLVEDLKRQGYLVKTEAHSKSVGHCYRCSSVIEPLLSKQWFVRMKPLAKPAMEAVLDGRIRFVPERFSKIYLTWLENIRDWCISRQIWWGHRIPAWYCQECGEVIVAKEDPVACTKCGGGRLQQDEDVLDTWFSSALWPFSTMGWPDSTADLEYFFPTSVLVTGYDIIFFWVARMIFTSLEFMNDIPFKDVLIHGLVRDSEGRKMSKSLGNGIDPLDVIENYGADTLRFTLITGNTPGNDMRFYWERAEASRNFANKLWNAARFVQMNLGDFQPTEPPCALSLADRWILSRLHRRIQEITAFIEEYELGEAARALYDFIWDEYCDWYIELTKVTLYGNSSEDRIYATKYTLWYVLERVLRLLHPFMPFISEEIWQAIPHEGNTLVKAPWPEMEQPYLDEGAEDRMRVVMDVVRAIRNMRAEVGVPPTKTTRVVIRPVSDERARAVRESAEYITALGRAEPLDTGTDMARPKTALATVVPSAEVYLPLEGLLDLEKELARLQKSLSEAEADLERSRVKLANPDFVRRAPEEVVEKERKRLSENQERVRRLQNRIRMLNN